MFDFKHTSSVQLKSFVDFKYFKISSKNIQTELIAKAIASLWQKMLNSEQVCQTFVRKTPALMAELTASVPNKNPINISKLINFLQSS